MKWKLRVASLPVVAIVVPSGNLTAIATFASSAIAAKQKITSGRELTKSRELYEMEMRRCKLTRNSHRRTQ
jgi:hypothetical protein